jgi:hypothetical protein
MKEMKEPEKDLNKMKVGLMYNRFVQTVGSLQCGSTLFAFFGIIVCAISLAVNSLVFCKTVTS